MVSNKSESYRSLKSPCVRFPLLICVLTYFLLSFFPLFLSVCFLEIFLFANVPLILFRAQKFLRKKLHFLQKINNSLQIILFNVDLKSFASFENLYFLLLMEIESFGRQILCLQAKCNVFVFGCFHGHLEFARSIRPS